MGMENNNLNDDEIAFIEKFKEAIDKQVDEMEEALQVLVDARAAGNIVIFTVATNRVAHLSAELCMYHFTLGREFERQNATTH